MYQCLSHICPLNIQYSCSDRNKVKAERSCAHIRAATDHRLAKKHSVYVRVQKSKIATYIHRCAWVFLTINLGQQQTTRLSKCAVKTSCTGLWLPLVLMFGTAGCSVITCILFKSITFNKPGWQCYICLLRPVGTNWAMVDPHSLN